MLFADPTLPAPAIAEVRVVAATPDTARRVAQALRARFAGPEQRSYPAGDTGTGTCLRLTVDTARTRAVLTAPSRAATHRSPA